MDDIDHINAEYLNKIMKEAQKQPTDKVKKLLKACEIAAKNKRNWTGFDNEYLEPYERKYIESKGIKVSNSNDCRDNSSTLTLSW